MKDRGPVQVPIVVTVAIGLIILVLGWRGSRHLSELREDHGDLLEQVRIIERPAPLSARSQPKEDGGDGSTQRIARSFISCGIEFKDCYNEYAVRRLDLASRDRITDAIEGVMTLDQAGLEELVAILSQEPDLGSSVRRNLLTFALARWGSIAPRSLVDHLAGSDELKNQLGPNYLYIFNITIPRWANEAPDDVLHWMKQSRSTLPEVVLRVATSRFAHKIASSEAPLEVFDFVAEFSDDPHSYFPFILRNSELAVADRAEAIHRIGELADRLDDPGGEEAQKFLSKNLEALVLSHNRHEAEFQTAIETIEAADLEVDEIEFIWNPAINDLGYHIKKEQAGDWILWLRDNIPGEKSQQRVKQLLKSWSGRDPTAAAAFIEEHQLQ